MTKLMMKKNRLKTIISLAVTPFIALLLIQCRPTENRIPKSHKNHPSISQLEQEESIGHRLIAAAHRHMGKPYLAHTLDKTIEEKLVVRTDGFDCTTLVETVIAEILAPTDVNRHVQKTRYRNGEVTDYASRIHYFTEWIYENQNNGLVTDVTPSLECSKPYTYTANYMSKNRGKYAQLKTDDKQLSKIKEMEERISQYKWSYIPKAAIDQCEKEIRHGDILVITTNIQGLETSHLGLAYKKSEALHLLHASSDEKKVVISSKTLKQYLMTNSKQTGIMVVRLNE